MPKFVGFIEQGTDQRKRVIIDGETLKEAMANAGYMPMTNTYYAGTQIGKLTTGQRFSFRLSPARPNEGL